MEAGITLFPDVGPDRKSGRDYWQEALQLVSLCDELGYTWVRTVEHYFLPYGGYSPSPLVFLAAAAMRTARARLVTGAIVPIFNHPLKMAGEIGMVDALCGGRLEVGFARAFLPHEFARFGIPVDESRARFDEGMEQVRRLLEEENVTCSGQFHSFESTTSLPRPTQKPRPPFWVAAVMTPESFQKAGAAGHSIMAIPLAGARMRELLGIYRGAWREAGHPGNGRVMLAFHMFCADTEAEALGVAREPLNRYLKSFVGAASGWRERGASRDYPGYDKLVEGLERESCESLIAKGAAWIGTPETISRQVAEFLQSVDGFDIATLQVNFGAIPLDLATRSITLFAREVLPKFR